MSRNAKRVNRPCIAKNCIEHEHNNLLLQAVLLVFIMSALIILARTSDLRQSATLQELMGVVSGRAGSLVTAVIVTVYTFGTCITFLIIIGDQFDRAFDSLVGPDFCDRIYLNRNFLMPVTSSKCPVQQSNARYCSPMVYLQLF